MILIERYLNAACYILLTDSFYLDNCNFSPFIKIRNELKIESPDNQVKIEFVIDDTCCL